MNIAQLIKEYYINPMVRQQTSIGMNISVKSKAISKLLLIFPALVYLSSAVLSGELSAQKKIKKQGTIMARNMSEASLSIFKLTCFGEVLNIE